MKTALRTIRLLLDLALLLLVVGVLALVLAANVGPAIGHRAIVIRGGSMEPAIHMGSLVDIVSVPVTELHPGDVVTLEDPDGVMVTHRITRIVQLDDGWYVEVKGDANQSPDPVLDKASAIQGRVDFSVPGAGFLMYMLTIPSGVISVFALAATLLLAIWLLEDLTEDDGKDAPEPYESDLARNLAREKSGELIG